MPVSNSQKVLRFGCAPLLLLGVAVMGPTSEFLSRRDASDISQLAPGIHTVSPDPVDTSQEGKLVFVSGPLQAAPIHDPELDLTTPGLRLVRKVHIWQWIQQVHDITQTNPTTHKMEHVRYEYSYYQGWSEKPLDSSKYVRPGHENPAAPRLPEATNFIPIQLQVGAYKLPPELINQMGGAPEWHPPAQKPARPGTWDGTKGEFFPNLPTDGKAVPGTVRITYQVSALPAEGSALGQLRGDKLVDFKAPSGTLRPPELRPGRSSLQEFVANDIQSTQLAVWFFRIADGLALLLAAYFLGLRKRNLVILSAALFALLHLIPGLFAG